MLDIGSGSGLFSLAARRLGARVHSFDYDTDSRTYDAVYGPGVLYAPQVCPWGAMSNDLERPVYEKYLLLPTLKTWLLDQPESRAALMSGSGSTVFAVTRDAAGAAALAERAGFAVVLRGGPVTADTVAAAPRLYASLGIIQAARLTKGTSRRVVGVVLESLVDVRLSCIQRASSTGVVDRISRLIQHWLIGSSQV